jgi:hypothetical protein
MKDEQKQTNKTLGITIDLVLRANSRLKEGIGDLRSRVSARSETFAEPGASE